MLQLARCAAIAAASRAPPHATATLLAAQPCTSLLCDWLSFHEPAAGRPASQPYWQPTATHLPHALHLQLRSNSSSPPSPPRLPESNSFLTPANMISVARALSGPVVAQLIITESWPAAIGLLVVSGASDWLDGYVARKYNQQSVLGTYMDPLADKILINCVVGALLYKGMFPVWLGALILGRDAVLVGVSTAYRFKQVGWRWPGAAVFFQLGEYSKQGVSSAQPVQPLMISKVNTVLQLALVAGCIGQPLLGWPHQDSITMLAWTTAATTAVSWALYAIQFKKGR